MSISESFCWERVWQLTCKAYLQGQRNKKNAKLQNQLNLKNSSGNFYCIVDPDKRIYKENLVVVCFLKMCCVLKDTVGEFGYGLLLH